MKNPFLNLKSDKFLKNIILVFFGTFLTSLCNLLYQLIIAHRLTAEDFAAFNSLLSIYMLISTPLITLQLAVAKRTSELSAARDSNAIKIFLSGLLRKLSFPIAISFIIFYAAIIFSMSRLKIYSPASGNIITILFFFAWLVPIFIGSLQGLERFGWLVSSSVVSGIVKLILVIVFMGMGFKIAGALAAFLLATFFILILSIIPLRRYLTFKKQIGDAELKSMFIYLLPIMLGNFCYMFLINSDIVLVKYYFPPEEAGFYALAQMVGKILLFLPAAISIVMFPRVSRLNAQNSETNSTLTKSLFYAFLLCLSGALLYNLFPHFVLKILTGKAPFASIQLGRIFSISMTFYAMLYIHINYFLSIKDYRFLKYLLILTFTQFIAIILFHKSIFYVQSIMAVVAVLIFMVNAILARSPRKEVS